MKALTQIILIAAAGVVASLLLFLFLIGPSLERVSTLSLELMAKRQQETTLDQQIRAYKTAQSDLSKAGSKEKIQSVLVNKENLVEAIQNMERAASESSTQHDLKIIEESNVKVKPVPVLTDKPGLAEVPYRLTTINSFLGTIDFLSYLEHLPQFTEISKINLSAELAESDRASVQIRTGRVLGSFDGIFVIKNEEAQPQR